MVQAADVVNRPKIHLGFGEKKSSNFLSLMLSEMYRIEHSIDGAADDIAAYGAPSECMDIVRKGYRRDVQEFIERLHESYRLTFADIVQAVEHRVGSKWVEKNMHSFGQAVAELEAYRDDTRNYWLSKLRPKTGVSQDLEEAYMFPETAATILQNRRSR